MLELTEYQKVCALFAPLDFHLNCPAVLAETSPGMVFVDDLETPTVAFISSPEGCYIAGTTDNALFNEELGEAILSGAAVNDVESPAIIPASPEWEAHFAQIVPSRPPVHVARRHYICTNVTFDWRAALPAGYSVERITADLLTCEGLQIPDHIFSWMTGNWGSQEGFLEHGFGFVTIHENMIVSWSLTDCAVDGRCEIGIHTLEDFRRRGLAAITAGSMVDFALHNGYREVGWQCGERNDGSIGTAEKVGFQLERRYTLLFIHRDEIDHWLELAYWGLTESRYEDARQFIESAFALKDEHPAYVYHMAARIHGGLNQPEQALLYLTETVKRGWEYRTFTESCAEFTALHAMPEWANLLEQMK